MRKEEFFNVLEEILEEPPGTIVGDEELSRFSGWDSLGMVAFIGVADNKLGVSVAPTGLVNAESVSDLLALVAAKLD
jgi:acyl carrier protein